VFSTSKAPPKSAPESSYREAINGKFMKQIKTARAYNNPYSEAKTFNTTHMATFPLNKK